MSEINDWILCYIDEHIEEELTVTGIAEEASLKQISRRQPRNKGHSK